MATGVRDELISVRQAAKESGRNMETIRRWVWSGRLPAQKLGNQLFIKGRDWQVFCKKHKIIKGQTISSLEFLKKARVLREQMRRRTGTYFNITELVEESRKGLL